MGATSTTWLAVRGVLAILFGIATLVWPHVTILALAILFAVYVLIDGIDKIVDAFRGDLSGGQRGAYAAAGLLGVLVGVLTLFWPAITVLALVVLIGAWAVVTGVLDIVAATRLRRSWPLVGLGALSILAGLVIFFRPGAGALAIAIVVGVYAIIAGVLMLAAAWQLRQLRQGGSFAAPAGA